MALKLITTVTHGKDTAKVYRDDEWSEWRVKYYKNGVYRKNADSHHGDEEDARDTARWQVERLV